MPNILFAIDRDFASNSAVHVSALANELCLSGFDCAVAVPSNKQSVTECGEVRFHPLEFCEADQLTGLFPNGAGPDIVHSWTPREITRKFCDALGQKFMFKQVVHLEDNEELLIEKLHPSASEAGFADDVNYPEQLSHPERYKDFLRRADGITIIIEKLKEFVPAGVATLTLWPGVDTNLFYPRPADSELKRRYGVPINVQVIVYPGNVHPANAEEVRSLYLAVALLNREGYPTFLVRTGRDYCEFLPRGGKWIKPYLRELGFVAREQMPELLALADVFVQPGLVDRYNAYRFPSKLPEFLAMGKPTILPSTNVGLVLAHEQEALVLETADGIRITEAVTRICDDLVLRERLSAGAVSFVQTHLSWVRQAAKLMKFYEQIC